MMARLTREQLINEYEQELKKLGEKIEKLGDEEVDLEADDDERNPFTQLDELSKQYSRYWRKLCKFAGSSASTGRHIERKIRIRADEVKAHPHLVKKIEDFINKQPMTYVPDFGDIKNVVVEERRQIPGEQVNVDEVAKAFREHIVMKLRSRRLKDLFESIDGVIADKPPPEDPEVLEKLNENSKLAEQKNQAFFDSLGQHTETINQQKSSSEEDDDDAEGEDNDSEAFSKVSSCEDSADELEQEERGKEQRTSFVADEKSESEAVQPPSKRIRTQ